MPGETSHTEISAVSQRNWLRFEVQEALAILSRIVLGFARRGQRFWVRSSGRRGEVPCATGCGDQGKTQGRSRGRQASPTSNRGSLKRARRKTRIAADGQHRDAPQGEHGGVLYAGRVVTDDGCTGSHSPNKDENEHKGERLNARKAHHRIRHRILCKMVGLVGRWVPSVARTTEIRVRVVVVVAPSAGGGRRHGGFIDTENDRKATPFHTRIAHLQIAHRIPCKMQWFSYRLSAFYAENDRFSCPPRAIRSTAFSRGAPHSRNSRGC